MHWSYYIYFNNTEYTSNANGNNYERGSLAKLPIYFDQYMTWWQQTDMFVRISPLHLEAR